MARATWFVFVLVLAALAACGPRSAPATQAAPPMTPSRAAPILKRPVAPELAARIQAAQRRVEAFFGRSLMRPYDVHVVPTRAAMQQIVDARWRSLGALPCWAVAVGTGSTFLLLDPAAWQTEACDHGGDTAEDVDRIITHELVHVYHGQHRPNDPEFEKADEVGWFVEGLATYASGQLTEKRVRELREAIAAGGGPTKLADVWTGKLRYAAAGTLAQFLDAQIGRQRIVLLMTLSTNRDILAFSGFVDEAKLVAAWRAAQSSYK